MNEWGFVVQATFVGIGKSVTPDIYRDKFEVKACLLVGRNGYKRDESSVLSSPQLS